MSLNLRRPTCEWAGNPADRWSVRQERVQALLRATRPEVLAAQEVLPQPARLLQASLGSSYDFIGRGRRRGGRGEGCPVFFDTDRLELLDWRQLALSDTPQKDGSRSWGNLFPRIVVIASFRDKASAAEFWLINTHLDPFSRRSRLRSAGAIRGLALEPPGPVVVAGDFNARPGSAAIESLLAAGELVDAWHTAAEKLTPEYATLGRYRQPRPGSRIDWIVVSPDVHVESIGINALEFEGGWPSDHLPVQAEIAFPRFAGPS